MAWVSNHTDKYKIEEKTSESSRSSKVVGLGLADLREFPTLIMGIHNLNNGDTKLSVFEIHKWDIILDHHKSVMRIHDSEMRDSIKGDP